jgi:hypothetical protein
MMKAIALLPRECGDVGAVATFKHPRTGNDASFLIDGLKVYEILSMDRPHSSWFLGDEVHASGEFIVASPIHPLFLVLTFLERRDRNAIPAECFFAGSPYEGIHSILQPWLFAVCVENDAGLVYDHQKAVEWIVGKCGRLCEFFRRNRPDSDDQVAIEMAFDAVRHFLHRDVAADVRKLLAEKYPGGFRPKVLEATDTTEEKQQGKKKSPRIKGRPPVGNMAITAFFAPKPSPQ